MKPMQTNCGTRSTELGLLTPMLLTAACLLLPATNVSGTSFRLTPVDLGGGYSITGSVTTDGTLGDLGPGNFTSWKITVRSLTEVFYTPANTPGAGLTDVFTDGQRMTVATSPDGLLDGGSLAFRAANPQAHFGVIVADFGGAFIAGGTALYVNGADFQYLPLNQHNGLQYAVAQAQAPGSGVYNLRPINFGGGVSLSGTLTTDGTLGALAAQNLTDWNIRLAEVATWSFTERNSDLFNTDGLTTDGHSIFVANPDGNWGFGRVPGRPGGDATFLQLADFSDPNLPGGQAAFIDPFNYVSVSPLSFDPAYVAATQVPESTARAAGLLPLAAGLLAWRRRRKPSLTLVSATS
jgi:hypothetical protein